MDINDRFADYVHPDRVPRLSEAEAARRVLVDILQEVRGASKTMADKYAASLEEKYGPPEDSVGPRIWLEDCLEDEMFGFFESVAGARSRSSIDKREIAPPKPPAWFQWYSVLVLSTFKPLQHEALFAAGRISAKKAGKDGAEERETPPEHYMEVLRQVAALVGGEEPQTAQNAAIVQALFQSFVLNTYPAKPPEEPLSPEDFVSLEDLYSLIQGLRRTEGSAESAPAMILEVPRVQNGQRTVMSVPVQNKAEEVREAVEREGLPYTGWDPLDLLKTLAQNLVVMTGCREEQALAWLLSDEPFTLPYLNATTNIGGYPPSDPPEGFPCGLPTGYVELRVHPSVSPNQVRDFYAHTQQELKAGLPPRGWPSESPPACDSVPEPKDLLFDGLQAKQGGDRRFELLRFASRERRKRRSWEQIHKDWEAHHPGVYKSAHSMRQIFYKDRDLVKTIDALEEVASSIWESHAKGDS